MSLAKDLRILLGYEYRVGDKVIHIPSGIVREITEDRAYLVKKFTGDSNYKLVN